MLGPLLPEIRPKIGFCDVAFVCAFAHAYVARIPMDRPRNSVPQALELEKSDVAFVYAVAYAYVARISTDFQGIPLSNRIIHSSSYFARLR